MEAGPIDAALMRELEGCAYAAWPAAQVEELGGWRARYSPPGLTRRANSVWVGCARGDLTLDERIDGVREFYDRRGAEPIVQLTPLAEPAGLDTALERRGWSREAEVSIQIQSRAALAASGSATPGLEVESTDRAPEAWLELARTRSRFAAAPDFLPALLGRLGADASYVLARHDGAPVAIALGVTRSRWLGIFSMFTVPEARRTGAARALLTGLADLAATRGAARLYLQVERDNPAALALYRSAGFREVYGYHYRRLR